MTGFDTFPSGVIDAPKKFELHVPDEEITELKQLVKASPIGPITFENEQEDRRFGMTRKWLTDAKEFWLNKFDWRAHEKFINSFPNFKASIKDDDGTVYEVHFAALFSKKKDAIPIAFFHGWPGSFLEFLPMLDVFRKKYSEDNLPYHLIVPSLVGYTLSSGPRTNKTFKTRDITRVMDKLMKSLGFESGYVAQGGDIGSTVTRLMGANYASCKAAHVNMCATRFTNSHPDESKFDEVEKAALKRRAGWIEFGSAYAREHGTRPATIGLVLSSSPLALLAWIGEKFLEWTDEDPSVDTILESISLYWFTKSFPRGIFPYREWMGEPEDVAGESTPEMFIKVPFGYSWFPYELMPTPKAQAAETGNLVWHRQHTKGGHFAALERPDDIAQDIEDFVAKAWPMGGKAELPMR